jgi:hypothetical protein
MLGRLYGHKCRNILPYIKAKLAQIEKLAGLKYNGEIKHNRSEVLTDLYM